MKVWIDLSNSPHPLLFAPIVRRLESLGHPVRITARDNAQTLELALQRWDDVEVIGGPSMGGRASKGGAMLNRIRQLASWARAERPDVALSHNSYAQIVAARAMGVHTVTAMDYEHQPANHLAFRLAHTVLLPEALAGSGMRRQGATARKLRVYPGLKEEIYLGDFEPDRGVLADAGVERGPDDVLVVARTPPSGALYHRSDNPLFVEALRKASSAPRARCVVLARRPDQRKAITALELPNVVVPERALDARSLMHSSDLILGAGGTMTREGALLGVPTLSLFAGRTAAVDRWLEERGELLRVSAADELPPVRRRSIEPRDPAELRERSDRLVGDFVTAVLEAPRVPRPAAAAAHAHG
jgi:predicted glycosyltransferase